MKYTNPRLLLKPNEVDMYDLMLRTSRLLEEAADGGVKELAELFGMYEAGGADPESARARDGLHNMLTYVFTCGVAFAVDQQVKNAMKVVEDMRKN